MRHLVVLAFWLAIGAGCHKDVDSDCVEKPAEEPPCPAIFGPVCGCNGKTYSNPCSAEAHGISIIKQGECGK